MSEIEAARTLVKSPPELWAVCSDAESLSQHLQAFGEIKITRLEPETAVAWEGESTAGTVRIEPSGWGTRVTLTARALPGPEEPVAAPQEPVARAQEPVAKAQEPFPDAEPEPNKEIARAADARVAPLAVAAARGGLWARLFGRRPAVVLQPVVAVAAPEPSAALPERSAAPPQPPAAVAVVSAEPQVAAGMDREAALGAALESLGQAHHRPFSRG